VPAVVVPTFGTQNAAIQQSAAVVVSEAVVTDDPLVVDPIAAAFASAADVAAAPLISCNAMAQLPAEGVPPFHVATCTVSAPLPAATATIHSVA
jgi:hypothetical protein